MTVLILRLSNSRDTAASSTHRVLADLVASAAPDAEIDFAFLPPKKAPRLEGRFSGRELSAFDLILVVNSFVQEALNLPWLLNANGAAPWAPDRPDDFPPILLGGSNAFAAQCLACPNGEAVPDAFFFGEAEGSLPTFVRRWSSAGGGKRMRLLQAAEGLDGFWVTGALPETPVRQAVARVPVAPAAGRPLPDVATVGTVRIPVGFGCAASCSFCFEGYERKPYRETPLAETLAQARLLKAACGARTAELDAFNLNTYAPLAPLVEACVRLFDQVAFKSQRADGIAACPAIVDLERAAGKSAFTLGVEGISARMRAFLAKSLSDADLYAALSALLERRVRELKLFFILTAHETPDDLAAFDEFCRHLRRALDIPRACTRVVLSFGRLVRMPHTPLARDRLFLDEADWRFCVDGVAAVCRRNRLEYRYAFDWPDFLGTQLLAACGHEHADAVVALACGGLTYHAPWRAEETAALRTAVPITPCAATTGKAPFPFVARAVSDDYLRRRWEEARQFIDTGYCLGATCSGCGACANDAERQALLHHARTPVLSDAVIEAVARTEADKRRLLPFYLRAVLPADFADHSPEWTAARLLQTALTLHPELTDNVLFLSDSLFSVGSNGERIPVPAGETVVALKAWDSEAAVRVLADSGTPFDLSPLRGPFAPGGFARATWRLATSAAPRDAAQTASAWLNSLRLPHTLRRNGDGWRFDLAPAALKKKCVFALDVRALPTDENTSEGDGALVFVAFSPKAALRTLSAALPPLPRHPNAFCTDFVCGST